VYTGVRQPEVIPILKKCQNSLLNISRQPLFNSIVHPQLLQGKQLEAYQLVQSHFSDEATLPLRMIISGTAGTGKSFLINCLKDLLKNIVRIAEQGCTLHSLFHLPTKGEFKSLEGERLQQLQESLAGVKYIIIDEMSMVGRKLFGQVDSRLRQAFLM
jgi:ATP-dependent DNA helicase PIF1